VELAGEERGVTLGVAQLIGRYPKVICLLRQRERFAVPIRERAAPRRQHDMLGTLYASLGRPPAALN